MANLKTYRVKWKTENEYYVDITAYSEQDAFDIWNDVEYNERDVKQVSADMSEDLDEIKENVKEIGE